MEFIVDGWAREEESGPNTVKISNKEKGHVHTQKYVVVWYCLFKETHPKGIMCTTHTLWCDIKKITKRNIVI